MNMIDWKRVAKPQPDAYDSYVIAQLLKDKYGWVKKVPKAGVPTICDGTVTVREDRLYGTDSAAYMRNGFKYWNEQVASEIDPFLRTWGDGFQMLQLFLDEFWPKWSETMTPTTLGCSSGHYNMADGLHNHRNTSGLFINAVYVTINSRQGCAEGIYHEVGHARLEALGMNIENHDSRLILNTPDELYDSPIRRDKKRPMSAVIQAIYSWIIFGENDIQCAAIPGNAPTSVEYLINNLPKIEDGLVEIRNHVKCTPEGTQFMDGFFEWGEDVTARARALCQDVFGDDFDRRYGIASKYKQQQQS